ncbi:Protein-serine/threonine phosphatase protein [Dioscorea alata]|uniref:Protein-serine/threonine phosphatase protein n=4 Tax=Dioscorea alata TaxID=55571 RepID=A0ACB7TZV5_DIOAL|nr:Protein-serine/threonine phosphatase protein [Dioscorea alata]KAH7653581.1 Protein-serine/threonine phosphatase protein [Dioscorea alata]KAH7653582.1 Protein-serine/threonine phosphatase protein [Dioscorea alata]KAH7653583.1 Protein-serine/threonine phosphatase protein [Dioscorea alata]
MATSAFVILDNGFRTKDNNVSSINREEPGKPEGLKKTSAIGKPPRNLPDLRHCRSSNQLPTLSDFDSGFRSPGLISPSDARRNFLPVYRSGSCSEIGPKQHMEDEHICIDNLVEHLRGDMDFPSPGAFYGVFDGHGGTDAASFVRKNILKFILEDKDFPTSIEKAMQSAYVKADHAFADHPHLDCSSGTTALTVLIFDRKMLIANAGDCRAVLGKRGRAFELSKDHKPNCMSEKLRIEKLGGTVTDGYLNGQLSVARAIGDWHMKGSKGSVCPLSAEPELQEITLTEEDEFLIIGCDGLWDVMSSQCAVTLARKELMFHNDPARCSRELVREAMRRNTCDNLTVVVVCFSVDPPVRIQVSRSRVRKSLSMEGLHVLKGALDCDF